MYEELNPRSEGWRMMEKLACSKLPRTTYARLLYICICICIYNEFEKSKERSRWNPPIYNQVVKPIKFYR